MVGGIWRAAELLAVHISWARLFRVTLIQLFFAAKPPLLHRNNRCNSVMSFDDRPAPMSSWLELWLKLGWKPSQTATRLQVLAVLAARLRPLPDRIESPTVRAKGLKSESQGLEDKGSGVLPLQQCCIV